MSKLDLYFPDKILSYFNNLSWSSVSRGLGNNWKNFADNLAKCIPDKNIDNFRTTCGNLKSIRTNINYSSFLQTYDFRKLGKVRMDSILNFVYNKDDYKEYMDIILHSRNKESVLKKLKNKI